MSKSDKIVGLVQRHLLFDPFDYNTVVDWAIEKIREGDETENILILSSFSNPIDKFEIRPYVTSALMEKGLKEYSVKDEKVPQVHYFIDKIIAGESIRKNLEAVYRFSLTSEYEPGLMNFYLLYHAWDSLESIGNNYYIKGVYLDNIEDQTKLYGICWVDYFVNGNENEKYP